MTSVLGYWDLRGLCHPIRLLLTYAGEKFEDKLYNLKGFPPTYDRSDWLKEKFSLNLDFPNLPYYTDGKVRLTQSPAILRYIARKYNLIGQTEEENIRIDLLESQLYDFREEFLKLCSNAEFETLKSGYLANLPNSIKLLSNFLGKRKYFAGDNLTYIDFLAYEYLYQLLQWIPNVIDDFSELRRFYSAFEALPQLSNYIKTSPASKLPLNMRMSYVLNKKS